MNNKFQLAGQLLINNQYLTISQVGKGGFGTVFKAWDFSLKNFIAIKKLHQHCKELKFIEMFYKEALIAKNLVQDNIVRIHHFWEGSDGEYYLVMDYLKGCDLAHLIKKCTQANKNIPWYVAIFICTEVLKAVDYAFRIAKDPATEKPYRIVYRDISPDNILVSFDGNIKLTDFGIARILHSFSSETKEKIIAGKYRFMSPEQISCEDIDHRIDIFSSGVLLYELLTGKQLFDGNSDTIKQQILHSEYNLDLLKKLDIPQEVVQAIANSIQKDRDKRYKFAFEFFNDLRQTLRGIKTEQEIVAEISELIRNVLKDEYKLEQESNELIKRLQLDYVCSNTSIIKITCKDFIPKWQSLPPLHSPRPPLCKRGGEGGVEGEAGEVIYHNETRYEIAKTVIKEVSKPVVKKIHRKFTTINKISIAILISGLLFLAIDIFLPGNLTYFGKRIYSQLFPSAVVVRTIPQGAKLTLSDRKGKVILSEIETPVKIKKILPGSYVLKATKEGCQPIEKIVNIEKKHPKEAQEIFLQFSIPVKIYSEPLGATVYIDSGKSGITPYQTEITASKHTIQLQLDGFETMNQCIFDLTQEDDNKIFATVDKNLWDCKTIIEDNRRICNLYCILYKKILVDSSPKGAVVYIDGEKKGTTPAEILLKAGKHKLEFSHPSEEYESTSKTVVVNKNSPAEIFTKLNKYITFKACTESGVDKLENLIRSKVTIKSTKLFITKITEPDSPLKIALPIDLYEISFDAGNEYQPLILNKVDISTVKEVVGKLKFHQVQIKIIVKEQITEIPVENAEIFVNNQITGLSNNFGVWEGNVVPGKTTIKIIKEGYIEAIIERNLQPAEKLTIPVLLFHE